MGFWTWLKDLFRPLIRELKIFLKQLFSGAVEITIAQLKGIAIQSVKRLIGEDLSDEEKRKKAFEEIRDFAISEGIEARDSIINLVLELAVSAIKKGITQ